MRSYAAIPPRIWQTEIKKLRGDVDAIAVHYHLTTSQHSNMIGLYTLPLMFLAYEIGSPLEVARKGLRRVIEAGICSYDEELEIVWVHDMAKSQVGPRLSPKDNRVVAVAKLLSVLSICPITLDFYDHYRELFHLGDQSILDEFEKSSRAPSKPLRSKEQEQEQDLGAGTGIFGSEGQMDTYLHAREADAEEPFDVPHSHSEGRSFLASMGLPPQFMEQALERMMKHALFPCDIRDWINEARGVS